MTAIATLVVTIIAFRFLPHPANLAPIGAFALIGGLLRIAPNESHWLGNLRETLDEMPDSEDEFISQQLALADPSKFLPAEYGL